MKTLLCGRVACSHWDEDKNTRSMLLNVWKTNVRIDGSSPLRLWPELRRLGTEMCIKIIYVQSLSHKILIMFWTWPWKLEVNGVPVASTPAAAQREPVGVSWGEKEGGRGPLVATSAQIYISKYFLAIYLMIKEIGLAKEKRFIFKFYFSTSCRRLHPPNGTFINTRRWLDETSVPYS